ncbi:MAG: hypothetical protein ABWX83_00355 [Luteibacter sp.]
MDSIRTRTVRRVVVLASLMCATAAASPPPLPLEREGDTFDTLHARYDARAAVDPDALHVLKQGANLCKDYEPEWRKEPFVPNYFKVFGAWQDRFCMGRNRREDFMRYSALEVAARARGDKALTLDDAVDVVLTSDSPAQLEVAARAIEASPKSWPFGTRFIRYSQGIPNLTELQGLAIRSIACDYSGACDAYRTETMWMCARDRTCTPDLTVFGQWAMTHSRETMVAVRLMKERLVQERDKRRAGR